MRECKAGKRAINFKFPLAFHFRFTSHVATCVPTRTHAHEMYKLQHHAPARHSEKGVCAVRARACVADTLHRRNARRQSENNFRFMPWFRVRQNYMHLHESAPARGI